jgi:glucose-6-phosphate 1-epimerase
MATVAISLDDHNQAEVHLHGATLTSWKVDGEELTFVSRNAVFDGKKAIRGGIPVVFPNFGPWDLGPQHGFARTSTWKLAEPPSQGKPVAVFELEDSEQTRAMWNYRLHLINWIIPSTSSAYVTRCYGDRLKLKLAVSLLWRSIGIKNDN